MLDFMVLVVIVTTFVLGTFCLSDAYHEIHWLNGRAMRLSHRLLFVVLGIVLLSATLNIILVFFLSR